MNNLSAGLNHLLPRPINILPPPEGLLPNRPLLTLLTPPVRLVLPTLPMPVLVLVLVLALAALVWPPMLPDNQAPLK